MNIDDSVKVCEALGLDPNKVSYLCIELYPKQTVVTAKIQVNADDGAFAEEISRIVKKYELVPVEAENK